VGFIRSLFGPAGLGIVVYILIGIFVNTAPPHLPHAIASVSALHSWVQYLISVFFWPLSLWGPAFTIGKWSP